MKKLSLLFLLFSFITILSSQENADSYQKDTVFKDEKSNLELANEYYDLDDYESAEEYYKKTIKEGVRNGTVFYRLGYSLENTKTDTLLMNGCYKAAVYCFERDSQKQNSYYEKARAKLVQNNLSNNYTEEDILDLIDEISRKKTWLELFIVDFLQYPEVAIFFAVIIYIIALILSKKTSCVIVFGWIDLITLVIPVIAFFLTGKKNFFSLYFYICFIVSSILSIIGNFMANRNILLTIIYSLVSVTTKIILLVVIPIMVLCYLMAATSGDKDKRYRDGTKNNERTSNIAFVFFLISAAFIPMIKGPKDLI